MRAEQVGLRRSGLAQEGGQELKQLQEVWNLIYRSDQVIAEGLAARELGFCPQRNTAVFWRPRSARADEDRQPWQPLMVRLLISTGECPRSAGQPVD